MDKRFTDDPCRICANRKDKIEPGDDFYEYDGESYCSEECVKDALFEAHQDEISEEHLYTADDRRGEYADMMYEQQKDDELCEGNRYD